MLQVVVRLIFILCLDHYEELMLTSESRMIRILTQSSTIIQLSLNFSSSIRSLMPKEIALLNHTSLLFPRIYVPLLDFLLAPSVTVLVSLLYLTSWWEADKDQMQTGNRTIDPIVINL